MRSNLTVKVGRLPGRIVEVDLPSGRTIKDALGAADIRIGKDVEITRNGDRTANFDDPVRDSDTILVVEKIRGA